MPYVVLAVSILAGLGGIYVGYRAFGQYGAITRSTESVPTSRILWISAEIGIATCLVFFSLIAVGGAAYEGKVGLPIDGLPAVFTFSLVVGAAVAIGSIYQIYTTVKYRDYLIRKGTTKKKE